MKVLIFIYKCTRKSISCNGQTFFKTYLNFCYTYKKVSVLIIFLFGFLYISDSARHRSQDICPHISQIVLKNLKK